MRVGAIFSLIVLLPVEGTSQPSGGEGKARIVRIVVPEKGVLPVPGPANNLLLKTTGEGADIVADISVSVDIDPQSGHFRYSYLVSNDVTSPRSIWSLTLSAGGPVAAMFGPYGWEVDPSFDESSVNWFSVDRVWTPPNESAGSSPYDIAPGASATFVLVSPGTPLEGGATYYLQGVHNPPLVYNDDPNLDAILDSQPSFLENSLSGTITGPWPVIGVSDEPLRTALLELFPNPSSGAVTFSFSLSQAAVAKVVIYNVAGRVIRIVTDEYRAPGWYSVVWDARDSRDSRIPPGVYFCSLKVDGVDQGSRRIVLLK